MQVVKGEENGYPVPGGWVTGRQPVTIKKKSGNLNYGLGTVRLSGVNLGSGKG